MTANEYNTKFSTQAARSGITEDKALIEYYMAGLPNALQEKILTSDNPPSTMKEWRDKASIYDNNYQRAKAIAAHLRGNSSNNNTAKKYNFRRNTPAAHYPSVKRGLCFKCHQPGHQASAHRARTTTYQPKKEEVKKTPYQNIRAILAELGDEERNVTLDQMEKEGF
ncbi:hypothetical protein BDZ94DRAFT_1168402 [Collybia nuda]|uniref:CCHC-type domain-containing protein n=1 Tax=Collybia nuda TaxID=64659 RepID=A0A9P5Y2H1_9AGAR|nr:hypothetical protein BDZ94DRAFT_1168402 [Collybia nuda]